MATAGLFWNRKFWNKPKFILISSFTLPIAKLTIFL